MYHNLRNFLRANGKDIIEAMSSAEKVSYFRYSVEDDIKEDIDSLQLVLGDAMCKNHDLLLRIDKLSVEDQHDQSIIDKEETRRDNLFDNPIQH